MSRQDIRALHLALAVPLVAVGLLVAHAGRTVRSDPAGVLAALRAAAGPSLPAANRVEAELRSEATSYDRDNLYELIDGAADAYLARGFERCLAADYSFDAATDRVEVSAEVHRFRTAAGAAEQLAAERPAAAEPVAGVAGAFADAQVLVAVRGRDLLKLVAVSRGVDASEAMVRIAQVWRATP